MVVQDEAVWVDIAKLDAAGGRVPDMWELRTRE
jgi:hypothetical protein